MSHPVFSIERPSSPYMFEVPTDPSEGGAFVNIATAARAIFPTAGRDAAYRSESAALEVRRAKLESAKLTEAKEKGALSTSATASSSAVSKDPDYYRQYVRDVYAILSGMIERGAKKEGAKEPREWIYLPLESEGFSTEFFDLIETRRSLPSAAGGLGREPPSRAQKTHHRLTFDIIKEIIENRNRLTLTSYPAGLTRESGVPRIGVKNERLAISLANFLSSIEEKVLESLFPKIPQAHPRASTADEQYLEDEYVEFLARKDAAAEISGVELEAALLAEDPDFVASVVTHIDFNSLKKINKEISRLLASKESATPEVSDQISQLLVLRKQWIDRILDGEMKPRVEEVDERCKSTASSSSAGAASFDSTAASNVSVTPSSEVCSARAASCREEGPVCLIKNGIDTIRLLSPSAFP